MKNIAAFVCILLFLLISCTNYKVLREAVIDVPKAINLDNKSESHIVLIDVSVKGKIDGSAVISLSGYGKAEVEGDFDWSYKGDWYSDTAIVEYEPIDAKTGELIIQYKFYEL